MKKETVNEPRPEWEMPFVVSNQEHFETTLKTLERDGASKLHVLADFDRTLTQSAVNGERIPSLISILRDEKYLTPDYPEKAQALYNHYNPIEKDPHIPLAEKKKAMEEWWRKHFDLLIASHLNKKDVERAVRSQRLQMREGVKEFFETTHKKNIPIVIMSSAGLGVEAITLYLKNNGLWHDNIIIVSNEFEWDANGTAVAIKEPIIHGFSKTETTLEHLPEYPELLERPNVLLLGDSTEDAGMVTGFPANNVLKIGFYNEHKDEDTFVLYRDTFDALITGDGTMEQVNKIVNAIEN